MIRFFTEDIKFKIEKVLILKRWMKYLAHNEGFHLKNINFIFCSDEYLLQMNKDYLQHDYYTDVITFDHSEKEDVIEGDIFISIDRVRENALLEKTEFKHELSRVLAHGILHLCGYKDAQPDEKETIRERENFYISILI